MSEFSHHMQNGELCLGGFINEDVTLGDLFSGIDSLMLNLAQIEKINSCGVREWINAIKAYESVPIVYKECSQAIIEQFNMIANFGVHGVVESFYAPYECSDCKKEHLVLLDINTYGETCRQSEAPEISCPDCDKLMDFDEDEEEYFMFLEN